MNNKYKYIFLYIGFIVLLFATIYGTKILKEKNILFQKDILIKEAQTHFKDQVNSRAWNSQYGGVFVKPTKELKPNPHLNNNTIKTEDGQTLIKINPAWMTRQLSELSNLKNFKFRITSLMPIDPNNKADAFETRALNHIESTNDLEYYELNKDTGFRYMGGLQTTKSCLSCHEYQGYVLGDIIGGISISLDTLNYEDMVLYIEDKIFQLRVLIIFLLFILLLLIHKQFQSNENLHAKVIKRTKEILSTKLLLQEVLDADRSFLMVSDETEIILANRTMLDFFGINSIEEFKKEYGYISSTFIKVDDKDFLSAYIGGEHWVNYLQREQNTQELKVLMKKESTNRYFKAHAKEIIIEDRTLHIIVFDEITKELEKIETLKEKASIDFLTKLFNKGKFYDILSKEIILAKTSSSSLSIIFLDIDYFKTVNDTYGHDAGDYVLIELSRILLSSVRQQDFIARWGGEEFIITLQSANIKHASRVAEKIRQNVENHHFTNGGKQTISLGVTQYMQSDTQASLIKRADEALYEAKNSGRNRVVIK